MPDNNMTTAEIIGQFARELTDAKVTPDVARQLVYRLGVEAIKEGPVVLRRCCKCGGDA